MKKEMALQIKTVLDDRNRDTKPAEFDTVFTELLNSKLPPSELSPLRLLHEAQSVIGAGFETTKWALTVLSYHILANPEIHARVKEELITAIPHADNIPPWQELQALPYLSACVEEGTIKNLCTNGRITCLHPASI